MRNAASASVSRMYAFQRSLSLQSRTLLRRRSQPARSVTQSRRPSSFFRLIFAWPFSSGLAVTSNKPAARVFCPVVGRSPVASSADHDAAFRTAPASAPTAKRSVFRSGARGLRPTAPAATPNGGLFVPVGRRAEFDLDPVMNGVPIFLKQRLFELLEKGFRRPRNVPAVVLFEERDVVLGDRRGRMVLGRGFRNHILHCEQAPRRSDLPWRPRSMTRMRFGFP